MHEFSPETGSQKLSDVQLSERELLRERHIALHRGLDELLACYLTTRRLSGASLMDFLAWSHEQTKSPSCWKVSE